MKKEATECVPSQPSNDEHSPTRSTAKSVCLVLTTTCAMILNVSSSTAVTIALPAIGRDLNVQEDQLQWIVSAFSLSSGCLLIFFGRLADLHGRKKAFLLGVFWSGLFALACGFTKSVIALDILRAFQGLGPAATIPASIGILAHAFPPSRARSLAFATFSAGAPIGGAVGIQIGGALTEFAPATWRAPFFLSAGLASLCFIGGCFTIDADLPSKEEDRRVDWIGATLVTTGLVLITFVLGQGELAPQGWKTPYIVVLLILGVVFIGVFIWWQYYLEHSEGHQRPPLMKLSMWSRSNGKFAAMQFIAFLEWSGFISFTFWAQLYYQDYVHLSPVKGALRMLPMAVTGLLCNFIVALVIGRLDVVVLVVIGTVFTGIACLLFAIINPTSAYWAFGFPAAITSVFGADFVFASGTLFIAKISLPHEQSLAGGLFQTLTQLGTAFGLAITTIVHNRVLRREALKLGFDTTQPLQGAPAPAQLKSYRAAQWAAFAFPIFGAVLAVVFLRGVGVVGHKEPSGKVVDVETSNGSPNEEQANSARNSHEVAKKVGGNGGSEMH
ncbi:MFS general substrate transporter [Rickenella mellea]|uniref:MFS general substrate transporter n=1 Tax=Rickenella mellea TaxID=50990 RepID=A0A4Y7Q196_9AGAM|nr:MFS general substrate transporter [Rickenella mellea]